MKLTLNTGSNKKENLFNVLKRGRLLLKSQMNLFGHADDHHEGDVKHGKLGTLVVKKNSSGHGGHWEYANKQQEVPPKNSNAIPASKAYDIISKNLGSKITISPKEGEEQSGSLKLINENSDGSMNIFFDVDGEEQFLKVPQNQSIINMRDQLMIKYADRDVLIDFGFSKRLKKDWETFDSTLVYDLFDEKADVELFEKIWNERKNDKDFLLKIKNLIPISEGFSEAILKHKKYFSQDIIDEAEKHSPQPNWMKTQEEFTRGKLPLYAKHGVRKGEVKKTGEGWNKISNTRKHHARIVESALKEGKNIPDEVLADYPQLKEKYLKPRSKEQVKSDNQLQIEIMQKAEIPEEKMADYALSSVADGKILRTYIDEVKDGEIDVEEAANRVKRDFEKMKAGEKEGKFIEAEEDPQSKPSVNKPKLVLNYKKAI